MGHVMTDGQNGTKKKSGMGQHKIGQADGKGLGRTMGRHRTGQTDTDTYRNTESGIRGETAL